MKLTLIPRLAWVFSVMIALIGSGVASADSSAGLNTLALSNASGPSGTQVTVRLALENVDGVKGIQADIVFDGAKAFFSGVIATTRSTGMVVQGEAVGENRVRLILYFGDAAQLEPGSGDVAEVTFTLQGAGGESTALTLSNMILSDLEGSALSVTGTNGLLNVADPLEIPDLQISALKNPGRVRTLQILVRISSGSGSDPTVEIGGSFPTMTSLGQGVWSGVYSATLSATSDTIKAKDSNILGVGSEQTTVSFQ
ncbi:MAG: cohesin domain-containing protein [Gemmatimonadales bacterium]|nr:cohesin domain-containing protein [Gemmatimonadales bacterium]